MVDGRTSRLFVEIVSSVDKERRVVPMHYKGLTMTLRDLIHLMGTLC